MINNFNNSVQSDTSKENKKINYFIYLFIFTVLLFFCVFGITYCVYKLDSSDNQIETGEMIFSYSDVSQAGNGINIKNATPISDEQGKVMVGENQYFDFSVTATTSKSIIKYKILIDKDSISTLSNDNVRVYLTQLLGGQELEVLLVDFSKLKLEKIGSKQYYILYEKDIEKGLNNYSDSYRIRMWVKEDARNYDDQIFKTKIDVYAYEIGG